MGWQEQSINPIPTFGKGIANIGSSIFETPATGAIARTATNIKAGAVSPVWDNARPFSVAAYDPFSSVDCESPLAALSAI
jgi:SulP family sulfate permease